MEELPLPVMVVIVCWAGCRCVDEEEEQGR